LKPTETQPFWFGEDFLMGPILWEDDGSLVNGVNMGPILWRGWWIIDKRS
jgi:hypothetical protein